MHLLIKYHWVSPKIFLTTPKNYFHLHIDATSLDVVTTVVDDHVVK